MRWMARPLCAPAPPCADPLAVVSVMLCPLQGSLCLFLPVSAAVASAVPLLPQCGDLLLEVRDRLKPPVDGGESQVSNLVKLAERLQDRQTHLMRGNLAAGPAPDGLLYPLGQDRELVLGHRPALAGPPHPVDDLVPAE